MKKIAMSIFGMILSGSFAFGAVPDCWISDYGAGSVFVLEYDSSVGAEADLVRLTAELGMHKDLRLKKLNTCNQKAVYYLEVIAPASNTPIFGFEHAGFASQLLLDREYARAASNLRRNASQQLECLSRIRGVTLSCPKMDAERCTIL